MLGALRRVLRLTRRRDPVTIGDPTHARTLIVVHNTMWDRPIRWNDLALPDGCALSTDPKLRERATAVVFHLPDLDRLPGTRPAGQIWVAWTLECEANVPRLKDPAFAAQFDLRMGYRLDSDVVVSYRGGFLDRLRTPPEPKTKGVALFLSGRADGSGRRAFLRELMRHVPVDSYGRVLNNRRLREDRGHATKLEVVTSYRFTLGFENAIATDYVTEKLYGPLAVGSVPVYLGAPNVLEHAPGDHSFVDVREFPTPRALAARLMELERDENAYAALLAWKTRPYRPRFVEIIERERLSPWVRLCHRVQELQGSR